MTADPTTTIAAHRVRHRKERIACSCGWVSDDDVVMTDSALHEAHLLAVLAEEGWDIVKLPEPDAEDNNGDHLYSAIGDIRVGPGDRVGYYDGWEWTVAQMREIGTTWLAAARAAEVAS